MSTLTLVNERDGVLHERARELTEFGTEELATFIQDMQETMVTANGIGLAAPQIGKSLQIFVIDRKYIEKVELEEETKKTANPPMSRVKRFFKKEVPERYINPRLRSVSKEEVLMEEGCLSVPRVFGLVSRPKKIEIEAQQENGKKFKLKADGLLARVLQHEMDHLHGVLFVEKATEGSLYKVKDAVSQHEDD